MLDTVWIQTASVIIASEGGVFRISLLPAWPVCFELLTVQYLQLTMRSSLTMGAILGVFAVLMKREILLAVIGDVFVIAALSVMLQVVSYRLRNKKRIFLCAPLHHHYEYKGWPEPKVVLRFWIICLLRAMAGIATLKFQWSIFPKCFLNIAGDKKGHCY